MRRALGLVIMMLVIVSLASAATLCSNGNSLSVYITGGYSCYIAGGNGYGDTYFTNFTYTPGGTGAPAATAVSVGVTADGGLNQDQAGFNFNGPWSAGATFTISFVAHVCTAADVSASCVTSVTGSSFVGAKAQEFTPLNGTSGMTNSFGGNSLNTSSGNLTVQWVAGVNPGPTSGTWSLVFDGSGAGGVNSIEADTYQQLPGGVPEPATCARLGCGLIVAAGLARKRR